MRVFVLLLGAAVSSMSAVAPVQAETLPLEVLYPAGNDSLSALNTLSFRPFGGSEGHSFAIELEQKLGSAFVRGAPYFSILASRGRAGVDGIVSGSASGRSESRNEVVRKQVCAARNDKGKCVDTRWVNENCTRRNITLSYTVAVEGRRQERVFAVSNTAVHSQLICAETSGVAPQDVVLQQLTSNVTNELRLQFAPLERREDIRVREGREGLQGNAKGKFRDAIRATKRNITSACDIWGEVDRLVPNHVPTLFNLGLCAEWRGDYNAAEAIYRRVLNFERSEAYTVAGIQRIELRRHAERQLAVHNSRKRP